MQKYLLSLGLIAAATLSLTSCLGNSTTEQSYNFSYGPTDCFNRILDQETGEEYIGLSPTYKFVLETNDLAIDIDISNLRLDANLSPISLRLPTMTMKVNQTDGFYNLSASGINPVGTGSAYEFDTFTMRAYPWRTPAIYEINYLVNDRYDVTVYPTYLGYYSAVTATNNTEGATDRTFSITDANCLYLVQINAEKMTATVVMTNAKFESGASTEDLEIRGLPVTLTESGLMIVTDPGVTYPIYKYSNPQSTTALSGYSMSDIKFTATLSTGAVMNFNCVLGQNSDEKDKTYAVRSTLRYFPLSTENQ